VVSKTEPIELRLNSNYENVWRVLKERLDEPAARLKSRYSTRLYLWAKQYLVVGHKRVSVGTLRKILGLEDVKDNSGRVVLDAPLELWANVKQRALDPALKEINKQSDIQLKIEFVGRGPFGKVLSLGFESLREKMPEARERLESSSIRGVSQLVDQRPNRPAVRLYIEGRAKGRRKSVTGELMTQYLVAIYHPDEYDPSVAGDEAMSRDIDTLNDEMKVLVSGFSLAACTRQAARSRCGQSLVVRC
jgi:hypothetical protein